MGKDRWRDDDWRSYSSKHIDTKASVDDIYTSKKIENSLDPKNIGIRESCDSLDNPNSTGLIVALDVTGSMGCVLDSMAREGLKSLATEVYNRKPIPDPHIMFMGVGDVEAGDEAPLQVTQFEAGIKIAEQLTQIYLERGGGGNNYESYILPWYFAANHTSLDCLKKRDKKGYLFTIGDEEPTPYLLADDIEKVFGTRPQFNKITAEELYTIVSRQYEVYHLIVEEGSHCRFYKDKVVDAWTNLIGQHAILLSDYRKMAEVIVSTLQVANGADKDDVTSSWDGTTGLVVAKALNSMAIEKTSKNGIVTF